MSTTGRGGGLRGFGDDDIGEVDAWIRNGSSILEPFDLDGLADGKGMVFAPLDALHDAFDDVAIAIDGLNDAGEAFWVIESDDQRIAHDL